MSRREARPMPAWWIAWMASAVLVILGLYALLDRRETWVTSDLDGHIATIDLYRHALTNGTLWPYDAGAAFGHDATPYYGWWFELALGGLAAALGACGVASASVVVGIGMIIVSSAAMPVLAAWCASGFLPKESSHQVREQTIITGAFAGIAFLLFGNHDGASAYGLPALTSLGLLNQGFGWCALLLVAGAAMRVCHQPDRWFSLPLALSIAVVLLVHTLSAIAAAVLLGWIFLLGPRRVVVGSGCLGVALAAGSLAPLLIIGSQQYDYTIVGGTGAMDPLLTTIAPYLQGRSVALTAEMLLQLACLVGGIAALGYRTSPARLLAIAGVSLVLIGLLPVARAVLCAVMPAVHAYRFAPLGTLLLLVASAVWAPHLVPYLRQQVRRPIAAVGCVVALIGLLIAGVKAWKPSLEDTETVPQVAMQLREVIKPGARVIMANAGANTWNRSAIERLRAELGVTTGNALHSIYTPPPLAVSAQAARSLGGAPVAVPMPAAMPSDVALRVLADLGVTHLIKDRRDRGRGIIEPNEAPIDQLPSVDVGEFRVWYVANPAAPIEAIQGPLLRCGPRPVRLERILLAEWWARMRSRHQLSARLVFAGPGDQHVHRLPTKKPTSDDTTYVWPQWRPLGSTMNTESDWRAYTDAFYEVLRPLDAIVRRASRRSPATGKVMPEPVAVWNAERQEAHFIGLQPGIPYLWRSTWSPGFTATDADLYEEVSGFTVLVPHADRATIRFSRAADVRVVVGVLVTAAAMAFVLIIARRRA